MRLALHLVSALVLSAVALPVAQAQSAATPAAPVKKPAGKLKQIVRKVADTAATTAAGMAVDTLLGKKGRALVSQVTGTGAAGSCPSGTMAVPVNPAGGMDQTALKVAAGNRPSSGAAIVNAAKQAVRSTGSTAATTGVAAPAVPAGIICQPVLSGGGAPSAAAMATAASAGMTGIPGAPAGMSPLVAATPVGMAVAAAPLAGQAVKGLKGMFGKKPMDKVAMLRDLGKGRLELKTAKFIEGTAELEPGYEAEFAALGEALPLSEGTYILHVAAEDGAKGEAPDTVLARKRIEKAWAVLLVNGVPDQKVIAVGVLPPEMQQGRKPPKRGAARIEFIRLPGQP